MAAVLQSVPEQGQLVRVRSRQWVVNEVKPSTLPPRGAKRSFDGAERLLTLASVQDDGSRDMPAAFGELDELLEDRGIGCRASADQEVQILADDFVGQAVIGRMIGTAVNVFGTHLPAFVSVVYGTEEAGDAIRQVEAGLGGRMSDEPRGCWKEHNLQLNVL